MHCGDATYSRKGVEVAKYHAQSGGRTAPNAECRQYQIIRKKIQSLLRPPPEARIQRYITGTGHTCSLIHHHRGSKDPRTSWPWPRAALLLLLGLPLPPLRVTVMGWPGRRWASRHSSTAILVTETPGSSKRKSLDPAVLGGLGKSQSERLAGCTMRTLLALAVLV